MIYYAVRRKKDKRYITGIDYRYFPHQARLLEEYYPPKLFTDYPITKDRNGQTYLGTTTYKINLKNYEVVKVKLVEVNEE